MKNGLLKTKATECQPYPLFVCNFFIQTKWKHLVLQEVVLYLLSAFSVARKVGAVFNPWLTAGKASTGVPNCHTLLLEERKPGWEGDGNPLLREAPWCRNGQSYSTWFHLHYLCKTDLDLQTEHLCGLQQSCNAGSLILFLCVSFPWISFTRQWLWKQDKQNLKYSTTVYWLMIKEQVSGTNTF